MNAPTREDIPADLLDQLDETWEVEADMKRMELWHDEYGHVVVTDDGIELLVKSWAAHDTAGSEKADNVVAFEAQADAATRAAEFALDLEREGREDEVSMLARIPILRRFVQ